MDHLQISMLKEECFQNYQREIEERNHTLSSCQTAPSLLHPRSRVRTEFNDIDGRYLVYTLNDTFSDSHMSATYCITPSGHTVVSNSHFGEQPAEPPRLHAFLSRINKKEMPVLYTYKMSQCVVPSRKKSRLNRLQARVYAYTGNGSTHAQCLTMEKHVDGESMVLAKFIKSSAKLRIPVFQRNYSWEARNVDRLLNDEWEDYKHKRTTFLGSIVTQQSKGSDCNIIDGQQRLTTINLILLALREMFKLGKSQQGTVFFDSLLLTAGVSGSEVVKFIGHQSSFCLQYLTHYLSAAKQQCTEC